MNDRLSKIIIINVPVRKGVLKRPWVGSGRHEVCNFNFWSISLVRVIKKKTTEKIFIKNISMENRNERHFCANTIRRILYNLL